MGLWQKLKEAVNDNLEETCRFFMDTLFLVLWLVICALGAKATTYIRRVFFDDEILTFVAFVSLEALFLIAGIMGAATYCFLKTKALIFHMCGKQHTANPQNRKVTAKVKKKAT